ncbi:MULTISPECIES: GNAT family N-acetyltransferase [Parachlamydia]|jgi:ribosomal protein S18 acetylase RimI-like enzyme|uniref:Blasticidin-S acetyltransferase n=2 Tax=Parachlamydia acanthamoebae TaxID=83552 RepID=F8KXH1_PARAV|nr:GNAT family N-acetyltransferase [Parachlamydia acanthamoebae]EFB40660.1 hypothetical protein pah_c197o043 [Parachlamydia acanthamoebae str. Hall's coccus]CCB87041.1 blasticidin-S acetyltransferase [Parachlamydia acanthamoebae UV-7]
MPFTLQINEEVSEKEASTLLQGINKGAYAAKHMAPIRSFGIFIKDEKENIKGGLHGVTYYGCLYVDMLWIDKPLRNQGWGTRLMTESEKVAKERNCTFLTVTTMDWEAFPFYQKLGYHVEFIREGYEKQSKMYFLRKNL